jgi:hypothetical protein
VLQLGQNINLITFFQRLTNVSGISCRRQRAFRHLNRKQGRAGGEISPQVRGIIPYQSANSISIVLADLSVWRSLLIKTIPGGLRLYDLRLKPQA